MHKLLRKLWKVASRNGMTYSKFKTNIMRAVEVTLICIEKENQLELAKKNYRVELDGFTTYAQDKPLRNANPTTIKANAPQS